MLRQKLLAVRAQRIRPGLDDKVLADWNGLMIAALANAGSVMGEPAWIEAAARAFRFVTEAMTRGDRLGHSWRDGRLLFPGLASDFAAMIKAALALAEATGERAYVDRALAWQAALDRHHADPASGGYFLTADDAQGLVVRPNATADDATPNPTGVTAQNLIRLAILTGDESWRDKADNLFDRMLPLAATNLVAHATLLNALDLRLHAIEIVVTGRGARADELTAAALTVPFARRIVLRAGAADMLAANHPARRAPQTGEEAAAFVCMAERCSLPVTQASDLYEQIRAMRG
jgi:uncharacterized protein YyaL (SSP411 family)